MEPMTKEQVDAAIEAGDEAVLNAVLDGSIQIVEEGEETRVAEEPVVEESPAIEEPGESPVVEEPVVEPVINEKNDDDLAIYEQEKEAIRRKYEEQLAEANRKAEETRAEARRLAEEKRALEEEKERIRAEAERANREVKIEEDEDDIELAGTFSKNNRKLIESLKEEVSNAVPGEQLKALMDKIENLEKADQLRQARIEEENALKAKKERMNKLYSEVDQFRGKYENFKTGRSIAEMHKEQEQIRNAVAEITGYYDQSEIEKAVRGVQLGDKRYEKLKEKMEVAGVNIPEDADKFFNIAEIVDLKNGYKYNSITGEFDEITDEFGNHVVQRSIEDAYKLSDFSNQMANARRKESLEIQNILDNRDNSATTLPADKVGDAGNEAMSLEEIDTILSTSSDSIKRNPELQAKLEKAYKQLGI